MFELRVFGLLCLFCNCCCCKYLSSTQWVLYCVCLYSLCVNIVPVVSKTLEPSKNPHLMLPITSNTHATDVYGDKEAVKEAPDERKGGYAVLCFVYVYISFILYLSLSSSLSFFLSQTVYVFVCFGSSACVFLFCFITISYSLSLSLFLSLILLLSRSLLRLSS